MSYAGRHLICCNLLGVKEKRKGGEEGRRIRVKGEMRRGDGEQGGMRRGGRRGRE